MTDTEKTRGLRYNTKKLRYDLEPVFARNEMVKVLTKGAEKYAPRNWEKGMPWMEVLASMKRHIAAFEAGEDYDPETGCLHMAHAMCNAAFITEYYKISPQYDDRPHRYLSTVKIGLDIDEVLADWTGHWNRHHGIEEVPEYWNFDPHIKKKFEELKDKKEFWLSIPPLMDPKSLPFEPHAYVTSRSIPNEWSEEWIASKGFPTMPVHSVPFGASKSEVLKDIGIDIFVDDRYENFVDINRAGICCFLYDAPHNRRYNVGYKRIKHLSELVSFL